MRQTFDDELDRTETTEAAIERGKEMARERARQDAPDEFCKVCTGDTPLAYSDASDLFTIKFMERAADAVADHIVLISDEFEDRWWIRKEMQDVYFDAYYEACAEPSDCEICANPQAFETCGHQEYGQHCPVRDEA